MSVYERLSFVNAGTVNTLTTIETTQNTAIRNGKSHSPRLLSALLIEVPFVEMDESKKKKSYNKYVHAG